VVVREALRGWQVGLEALEHWSSDLLGAEDSEELLFSDELPPEVASAKSLRINGEEVAVAGVDPGRRAVRVLGGAKKRRGVLLQAGANWIGELRFWWEEQQLHLLPRPYKKSYAILAAIDDYDRAKDPRRRGRTGFSALQVMVAQAEELKKVLLGHGFPQREHRHSL
jgi:hypothetical protein